MSRKRLTEETLSENQEGLLALFKALKVNADVSIYAKLVCGYIVKLYGREITKEDGYAHVSNAEMRKGCEIGSETMTNAVVELVNAGLITVERGKKRSKGEKGIENRYFLSDEIAEKIHFKTNSSVYSTETDKTNSSVYSTEKNQQMDELLSKIDEMLLKINELTEENRVLSEKVETIEKKMKSSMDMDMELEIINNNNINITSTRDQEGPDKKENSLATNKEKEQVYRLGKAPEETRMLLDSKLRAVGSRIVDFEHVVVQSGDRYGKNGFFKFQSELSEELEKLPSSEGFLRQDVMTYCHDLWEEMVYYTQPEPVHYKDFDFSSTLHEQVRPADFYDFEHLVRSSSKSLSGDRSN